MGGSGGGGSSNTTSQASIAPELQPLFKQTGEVIQPLQEQIAPQFDQFFASNVQPIPGFTQGQEQLNMALQAQAFGPSFNVPQYEAFRSLAELTQSPIGSSPATQAAMRAAREPIMNDLAMAGLANSDFVGSQLGGAYAPILAQEMAQRFAAIPQLQNLGSTAYQQQQQNFNSYGQSEEQRRAIEETRGQAEYSDMLRRQGLGSQFTTGILSGFPSVGGQTSQTKQSGGGGSVICTEMHSRGLLDSETYAYDEQFGASLPAHVVQGYRKIAAPIVRLMRRSDRFVAIITPIVQAWAREMSSRVSGKGQGSMVGKIIMKIGLPICGIVGKRGRISRFK